MKKILTTASAMLLLCTLSSKAGVEFPGTKPGKSVADKMQSKFNLSNATISCDWSVTGGKLKLSTISNLLDGTTLQINRSPFAVEINGKIIQADEMTMIASPEVKNLTPSPEAARFSDRLTGKKITIKLKDEKSGVIANWQAILCDGSNYIRQKVTFSSTNAHKLSNVTLIDLKAPNAKIIGEVSGSPVISKHMFFAFESPLSISKTGGAIGWSPADLTTNGTHKVIKRDVSSEISANGTYNVKLQYDKGNHALNIQQVSLLANGEVVAMDNHKGFTGSKSQNNIYKLKLNTFSADKSYTLAVTAQGSGGNKSWGKITLSANGKALVAKGAVNVNISYNRNTTLKPGNSYTCSSVYGVFPKGQLRRGFLYYLERERAHPYHQYLHYNSWYDLNINRPQNRMTEAEALASIKSIGKELVTKRGVHVDGFVMDDGWDSHKRVWDFHKQFPNGFSKIESTAKTFNAGIGLWMSPWGGYGGAKAARMKSGKKIGLETNKNGFSMAGKKYQKLFLSTCLRMVNEFGVNHFKFDGMAGGNFTSGVQTELADDIAAILGVVSKIRQAKSDVWINATVGTWPSPFWTRHADSIWRQGQDVGFSGVGSNREKWITYRDEFTYNRIVKRGPLFPLNALMFHGLVIGPRALPKRMELDEKTVRNEIRAAFACGTGLQELYITPRLLTPKMWNDLAESAKWSNHNKSILADTHWIGGSPAKLAIYGWASWSPKKGIISYRNPSQKTQTITFDIGKAFELPKGAAQSYKLASPYSDQRLKTLDVTAGKKVTITLKPFEVLTFDATPQK